MKLLFFATMLIGVAMAQPSVAKEAHDHREGATATGLASKTGAGRAGLRTATPQNSQPRRAGSVPFKPAARNAIGVSVIPHAAAPGSGGEHIGVAVQPSRAMPTGASGPAKPGLTSSSSGFGGPHIGLQYPRPVPSASFESQGRINGASPIRPKPVAWGLGGPAKTVGGINGTTLRPKH